MLAPAEQAAFHPGSYLRELLLWQRISPAEFSDITGLSEPDVIGITEGERTLDRTTSEILAAYFGNSSRFWLDLQELFDRAT